MFEQVRVTNCREAFATLEFIEKNHAAYSIPGSKRPNDEANRKRRDGVSVGAEERFIRLGGAVNVRDLGGYRTSAAGQTVRGRFIRSDSLHNLTQEDLEKLRRLDLACVIDLRREHEARSEPNPFKTDGRTEYSNISLFSALDPTEYMKRDNVLQELYIESLHEHRAKYAEVIKRIASIRSGSILFHCTMGKDRTGLVSAILLDLAGVARSLVLEDYALTEGYIAPLTNSLLARAGNRGIDPESYRRVLKCDPSLLQAALNSVEMRYGSIENWLLSSGVDAQEIRHVRARLVGPA